MSVANANLSPAQKRDAYAAKSEAYMKAANDARSTVAMSAILAKAQVCATLALAYKD